MIPSGDGPIAETRKGKRRAPSQTSINRPDPKDWLRTAVGAAFRRVRRLASWKCRCAVAMGLLWQMAQSPRGPVATYPRGVCS
jgi:hypothetical protein